MACITLPNVKLNADIIPDINSILPAFTAPFAIPKLALPLQLPGLPPIPSIESLIPTLPVLPTIPLPPKLAMPHLEIPSMTAAISAAGLVQAQMTKVYDEIISKIAQVLPLPPFPTIPGFPALPAIPALPGIPAIPAFPALTFPDLVAPDPMKLLERIRLPNFDFSLIPNLPTMWPTLAIPELKAFQTMQFAVQNYTQMMTDFVMGLFGQVIDKLKQLKVPGIPALPTLPTIPTIAQIEAMIPSLDQMLAKIPNPLLKFLPIQIPGFPSFALPDPLLPDFKVPNFEFTYSMHALYQSMSGFIMKMIVDFAQRLPISALGISFVFPTLSSWLPAMPTIPQICLPSIKVGPYTA